MPRYNHENIVLDNDGVMVMSVDGKLTCDDKQLLKRIRENSVLNVPVKLYQPFGEEVLADLTDYAGNKLGFFAAMMSVNTGRINVLEVPDDLKEQLLTMREEGSEDM